MDSAAIQSSLAKPRAVARTHSRAPTTVMERMERTTQIAMIVGYCDRLSTSGVALSTQPIALNAQAIDVKLALQKMSQGMLDRWSRQLAKSGDRNRSEVLVIYIAFPRRHFSIERTNRSAWTNQGSKKKQN